ncbi:MAG TPA: hypothetical protein PKC72_15945 [Chitinophagaceae bacterium]|nr:hypothetical protein [Chitinophagaceae bacterium]
MTHLSVEIVKKPYALVLHIEHPLDTVRRLVMYFEEIKLMVNTMEMYRYRNGDAMVILKCQVEEERLQNAFENIKKIAGVMTVEKMEGISCNAEVQNFNNK